MDPTRDHETIVTRDPTRGATCGDPSHAGGGVAVATNAVVRAGRLAFLPERRPQHHDGERRLDRGVG